MAKLHKLRSYFNQEGYSDTDIGVLIGFFTEFLNENLKLILSLYLTDNDIKAVERISFDKDFDDDKRAELCLLYFEDKYKLTLDEIVNDFLDNMYEFLIGQKELEIKLVDAIDPRDSEEVQKQKFTEIMEDYISKTEFKV